MEGELDQDGWKEPDRVTTKSRLSGFRIDVRVERRAFRILRTLSMDAPTPIHGWIGHAAPDLPRALGVSHATAIVVGTIIGSGIFLVPSEMMQAVGSAKLVYLAWLVGGLLSFFGALTYAELGAMKPQAGGEYVYVRDAYGPLGGFLYAWTMVLISKPASIATITTGFVRILGNFSALSFFSHRLLSTP